MSVFGTSSLSVVPSQSFYRCVKIQQTLGKEPVFQGEGGTYGFTAATPTEWSLIKKKKHSWPLRKTKAQCK